MESLAPELLHQICALACTDGGKTGCSLSLVSKYMRTTSRSTRFHSVTISGTSKQLDRFLSCFKRERAAAEATAHGCKPVVKHLFFAAAEGGQARQDWRGDPRGLSVEQAKADQAVGRTARVEAARAHYREDVELLFRLVARDLQTLCFVHCHGWYCLTNIELSDTACPEGFPALRELSVYGTNPFVNVVRSSAKFPRLTHLHLTFSKSAYGVKENKIMDWADLVPHVTHLYVSSIRRISPELEAIAANRGPFTRLRQLYLQPQAPPPSGGHCGNSAYHSYVRFKEIFDNFVAAASLPTKARRHQRLGIGERTEKVAMKIWLDRVGGGPGYWN